MGLFSSSKKYRTTRKRLKGALEQIGTKQDQTFANQIQALQSALAAVQGRTDQAGQELSKTYGAQRRDVRERGQQTFAAGSQDLARRGLGNTTITGGLHRGVGEGVSRELGRLSASEAGQRANLFTGLGGAEGDLYSRLAGIYGQQAGAQTALGLQGLPAATMTQQSGGFGSILGGAAQGASAGSSFGPWGTAIGGVLGGLGGYYG